MGSPWGQMGRGIGDFYQDARMVFGVISDRALVDGFYDRVAGESPP